jgi:anthranilate synthase component 2
MKILLLDNYDSFTYNLYHYLRQYCDDVDVFRNDAISPEDSDPYSHIVLSPGPGLPEDAGSMMKIIERQAEHKQILGVCLGLQAIAIHFGGTLYNLHVVKHGVAVEVMQTGHHGLFDGIPSPFSAGLYHSWAVNDSDLPDCLEVTARSSEGVIMAVKHKYLPISGVQFHPESILTPRGNEMIKNWVCGKRDV